MYDVADQHRAVFTTWLIRSSLDTSTWYQIPDKQYEYIVLVLGMYASASDPKPTIATSTSPLLFFAFGLIALLILRSIFYLLALNPNMRTAYPAKVQTATANLERR